MGCTTSAHTVAPVPLVESQQADNVVAAGVSPSRSLRRPRSSGNLLADCPLPPAPMPNQILSPAPRKVLRHPSRLGAASHTRVSVSDSLAASGPAGSGSSTSLRRPPLHTGSSRPASLQALTATQAASMLRTLSFSSDHSTSSSSSSTNSLPSLLTSKPAKRPPQQWEEALCAEMVRLLARTSQPQKLTAAEVHSFAKRFCYRQRDGDIRESTVQRTVRRALQINRALQSRGLRFFRVVLSLEGSMSGTVLAKLVRRHARDHDLADVASAWRSQRNLASLAESDDEEEEDDEVEVIEDASQLGDALGI